MSRKKGRRGPGEPGSETDKAPPLWPSLAVGATALVAYTLTLCHTVAGGDSAELTLAAWKAGVAHPPGYPLFVVLGKLFTLFPWGSVAARVSFLSAVCDAAAAGFVSAAGARWTRKSWAGVLAGGLFAFAPLTWEYAVVAEVFALNNLLVAAFLYFLVRNVESTDASERRRSACWVAFSGGLALSNHHTSLFFVAPAALWWLAAHGEEQLDRRLFAKLVGLFLLGLLPYLWLPIASRSPSLFVWGDSSTWRGFFDHFLRKQYGTFRLAPEGRSGNEGFAGRLGFYFATLPAEVLYVGIAAAAVGAVSSLRRERLRGLGTVTSLMFVTYLAGLSSLANLGLEVPLYRTIYARFFQQPNLLVALWASFGAARAVGSVRSLQPRAVALALTGTALLVQAGVGGLQVRRSRNETFGQFAAAVLGALPERSLLLATGDHIVASLRYFQEAEGLRRDIPVFELANLQSAPAYRAMRAAYPKLALPPRPEVASLKELLDLNSGRHSVFLVNGIRINDSTYEADYELWPMGDVDEFRPKARPLAPGDWVSQSDAWWRRFEPVPSTQAPTGTWEHELFRLHWRQRYSLGANLAAYASAHGPDRALLERAVEVMEEVVPVMDQTRPPLFRNPGDLYNNLKQAKEYVGR